MTEDLPAEAVQAFKRALRERIWDRLERDRVARFPLPVRGRIPNFADAEVAAARLSGLPVFGRARVIKCSPDAPQRPVRRAALQAGKVVLMPTPRLRAGFVLLDPAVIGRDQWEVAASLAGAMRLGRPVRLEDLPKPDLIVVGSVAVAPDGARVGKGEGYSELEYGILAECGLVDPTTPVATTVHDLQVVERIPLEPFDMPVDIIVTPTRTIETRTSHGRPSGILWALVTDGMLAEMPLLRRLRQRAFPPV